MNKQARRILFVAGLVTAAITGSAFGQQQEERLGNLSFPTSCDPKVQAEFERGVAMIHSYWFLIARRTFEGVLQQDPNCALAYWGIAYLPYVTGRPLARGSANHDGNLIGRELWLCPSALVMDPDPGSGVPYSARERQFEPRRAAGPEEAEGGAGPNEGAGGGEAEAGGSVVIVP